MAGAVQKTVSGRWRTEWEPGFCVVVERRFRDSWRLSTVGLRWMFQSVCGSGQSSGVAVTGLVRVEQANNELDAAHFDKYMHVLQTMQRV